MTPQQIKDGAPDGATHYRHTEYAHNIKYYKLVNKEWHFYSYDGNWYQSKHVTSIDQLKPL